MAPTPGGRRWGVYARRAFVEGEFIFRRRHSRVLAAEEIPSATEWERIHFCELRFDGFAVLAPPGCYLNHSCDPNAMRHSVKVFAWRPIAKGDEITIDYRLNAFDGSSWPCECGSKMCTGTVVGSFFKMDPKRQELAAAARAVVHPARVPASASSDVGAARTPGVRVDSPKY